MRKRWLAVVMCLIIGATFTGTLGCSSTRSATAVASMRQDLNRLPDDVQWALGLDEPSILYEDTFPPYNVNP